MNFDLRKSFTFQNKVEKMFETTPYNQKKNKRFRDVDEIADLCRM